MQIWKRPNHHDINQENLSCTQRNQTSGSWLSLKYSLVRKSVRIRMKMLNVQFEWHHQWWLAKNILHLMFTARPVDEENFTAFSHELDPRPPISKTKTFLRETSIHGLKFLNEPKWPQRIFWLISCGASTVFCLYVIAEVVYAYTVYRYIWLSTWSSDPIFNNSSFVEINGEFMARNRNWLLFSCCLLQWVGWFELLKTLPW